MPIIELHDRAGWNEFLLAQPSQAGIFLQSWEWGEFQKAVGRKVFRYKSEDGAAQVIELPLPLRKKYWFIPRGAVIDGLVEEAHKRGVWFIRFEPIQPLHPTPYNLHPTKPVSPTQTLIVDITKSEEELLAAMHEKTRYNVRLALRKGVRCQGSGFSESIFNEFWKLMQETAKRDKFRTHPRGYYETMLRVLGNAPQSPSPAPTTVGAPSPTRGEGESLQFPSPRGERDAAGGVRGTMFICLHLAYFGTTLLAAAIVGYFGDTATYLHGASSYEHRALMGSYGLHWQIMQEAKRTGYKFYDFWGTTARQHAAGIARFKMGFGGTLLNYSGTFDLPLNRFWYTVYWLGRKIL